MGFPGSLLCVRCIFIMRCSRCYGARTSGRSPCPGLGGEHRASPIHRRRARAASFITAYLLLSRTGFCESLRILLASLVPYRPLADLRCNVAVVRPRLLRAVHPVGASFGGLLTHNTPLRRHRAALLASNTRSGGVSRPATRICCAQFVNVCGIYCASPPARRRSSPSRARSTQDDERRRREPPP